VASQQLVGIPVVHQDQQQCRGLAQPAQSTCVQGKLDLYPLATLLFREADFVSVQCVLVSEL